MLLPGCSSPEEKKCKDAVKFAKELEAQIKELSAGIMLPEQREEAITKTIMLQRNIAINPKCFTPSEVSVANDFLSQIN